MSELRCNPVTGRWVIFAPERGHRPREVQSRLSPSTPAARFDPTCPFCPGNEGQLLGIIAETKSDREPGWLTRVVPNKFPAVGPAAAIHGRAANLYEAAAIDGSHEVLIESPRHDRDIACMPVQEAHDVLATCLSRYRVLMGLAAVQSVIVFRNRGSIAGASLPHPHSQLIALHFVPPLVRAREALMANYHRKMERCLLCDIVTYEQSDGSRIVAENDAFITLVPFAASVPCEIWILPKQHQADFADIQAEAIRLLAASQRDALVRLAQALDDPSYNYVIDTASKGSSDAPHLHWCLRILPQVTVPGGFELGSDLAINPSLPEEDAMMLRSSLPAMTEM